MSDPIVLFPCYSVPALATGDLIAALRAMGWSIARLSGSGAIDALRSAMASQALLTDAQWWLWLDSDVAMTPRDVLRLVDSAKREYRERGALMMAASYVTKQQNKARHTVEWPDSEPHMYGQDGQVYPLHACGFGAVVTHRSLFERLGRELPPCAFPNERIVGRPYFLPLLADGFYLQEDYAFCHRVRHTFEHDVMFCDTRIRCGHVGPYEYSWDDCQEPRPTFPSYDLTVNRLGLSTEGFADVAHVLGGEIGRNG